MTIDVQPLAKNPPILIASDYDGTLAPFVTDPTKAYPDPHVWKSFIALGTLPKVRLALLSGRGRAELLRLSGFNNDHGIAIGSHGGELPDATIELSPEQKILKAKIIATLSQFAESLPGALLENKPTGAALHVRSSDLTAGEKLLAHAKQWAQTLPEVRIITGNKILELSVVLADKGRGLAYLIDHLNAESALYIGDDITDEDGFLWLKHNLPDSSISIKIGPGSTTATHRIKAITDVAETFTQLYQQLSH